MSTTRLPVAPVRTSPTSHTPGRRTPVSQRRAFAALVEGGQEEGEEREADGPEGGIHGHLGGAKEPR